MQGERAGGSRAVAGRFSGPNNSFKLFISEVAVSCSFCIASSGGAEIARVDASGAAWGPIGGFGAPVVTGPKNP